MIILHAAGNEKIGIGNLMRIRNLSQYLLELSQEIILIYETTEKIGAFLKEEHCGMTQYIVKDRKSAWNIVKRNQGRPLIYVSDLIDLTDEDNDRFSNTKEVYHVHINDALQGGFIPDILIDEDPFEKVLAPVKLARYRGVEYKIFNKRFLERRPSEFTTNKLTNVLICFGGSDPALYTEQTLKRLREFTYLNVTIVLGPGVSEERKKYIKKNIKSNCEVHENVNDMLELIQKNDMVISLGGIIAYEATLLGKVSVAIKWSYMGYYVENLARIHLIHEIEGIEYLGEFLRNLESTQGRLVQNAKKGFELMDGLGGYRVRDIIKELIESRSKVMI